MRSLFVKIFLWFWAAMILVAGAAVLALHAYLNAEENVTRTRAMAFKNPAAAAAVEVLEQDGPDALHQYLERWNRHSGMRQYLFDDKGKELTGEPLPPEVVELAAHPPDAGTETLRRTDECMFVASRIAGPTGKSYVFVAAMPNRPPQNAGPFPFGGPLGALLTQPRILVLILAAVVLMSGVVCYGLARHLTGPLRTLQTSARQLADGDLTVRVGAAVHNRHDEMGDLGRDFDFMAERIESLVSAQRRLLRDLSHEFRSPLARLHVALGLARQRTGSEVDSALDRIEVEAHRLNELIGQLLELARLEGSGPVAPRSTIALDAMMHDIVADADFEARGCGREVHLLGCTPCAVTGVPDLLRSAIENVVRNAIRYTPEDKPVEIDLHRDERDGSATAVVRVRDHGPGVPADSLTEIFRPFYRVGDDRNRQTGGAGLGLAIAQQAMRVHGGAIAAANAPGGGLVVELRLPVIAADGSPSPPAASGEAPPPS